MTPSDVNQELKAVPVASPEGRGLFRTEAEYPVGASQIGEVVLMRPATFWHLTWIATAMAASIVLFMAFGTYTRRASVTGQLLPDTGILKVYAPQVSTIVEKKVAEGQVVTRGQVLYLLSGERRSSTIGDTQAAISNESRERIDNLQRQVSLLRALERQERNGASRRIGTLEMEADKFESAVKRQKERVVEFKETLVRTQNLLKQGFVAEDQVRNARDALLDESIRLDDYERQALTNQRQVNDERSELSLMPGKYSTQIEGLQKEMTAIQQELDESEARRQPVVTAPTNGTLTSVIGEVGQMVDASRPLVSLVPQGSALQAQLYVPSSAIGFVKPGDEVHLRYRAFPYQKFGHQIGVIATVSRTSAVPSEILGYAIGADPRAAQPVYVVTVKIPSQSIAAFGTKWPLQAGMEVDAEIMQEKRRLYEWALEPLLTLKGRL